MLRAHAFRARCKSLGARYTHAYERACNFLKPIKRICSNHYPLPKMFYENYFNRILDCNLSDIIDLKCNNSTSVGLIH